MTQSAIPAQFWIDVGGTFTDCIARIGADPLRTHKLLSDGRYIGQAAAGSSADFILDARRGADPRGFFRGWTLRLPSPVRGDGCSARVRSFEPTTGGFVLDRPLPRPPRAGETYELSCGLEAPLIGIRWLLGRTLNEPIGPVHVRLGTTRGTNALLELRGARTALAVTRGFADLLSIGAQNRPRLFDLHVRKAAPLTEWSIEIDERLASDGSVLRPLDVEAARQACSRVRAAGAESLAIALLHSYRNPEHERRLAGLARAAGFRHVSISSELSRSQRILPRAETAVVDAYLAPVVEEYLRRIQAGIPAGELLLMSSAGALVEADLFRAKDSVLSGPAGGVLGVAAAAREAPLERVIGFDMGGTSTDVCRYDGAFERRFELEIEDRASGAVRRLAAPVLAIETVAAGGGSICAFDGLKPTVGPHSAGADPGPACYGRGGPLCITDLNLLLGRFPPEAIPFPVDHAAVERCLDELIAQIESATGRRYGRHELAGGLIGIANLHMAAAIRKVSTRRGYDPREYSLVAFGGAGGQHACAMARELGMKRILIPALAGLLSALGLGVAERVRFSQRHLGASLAALPEEALTECFLELEAEAVAQFGSTVGSSTTRQRTLRMLDLRYRGQETVLTVAQPADQDWRRAFEQAHRRLYGFDFTTREIELVAARVETHRSAGMQPGPAAPRAVRTANSSHTPATERPLWFDGRAIAARILTLEQLAALGSTDGPAIIAEPGATIVVEPGWSAQVLASGDVLLSADERAAAADAPADGQAPIDDSMPDPITLEAFHHAFQAVAEQMGATLQRTALSTNVKERLDFSCAILDADAGLVAHAPHVPVHLGALAPCVRALKDQLAVPAAEPDRGCACGDVRIDAQPGDVFVTNDPYRGGSHLPDVTVITPVFDSTGTTVRFFAANRAHHAEIGGISPGSMPPHSRTLAQEGVRIPLLRLSLGSEAARSGGGQLLDEDALTAAFAGGPHPSRDPGQNLADLRAQIAANACGVRIIAELTQRHGPGRVARYMGHIQDAAEQKMRAALQRLPHAASEFADALDDGTPLRVRIAPEGDAWVVDFSGSGPVHPDNLNATPAIVRSAVLYCFRCLIAEEIPLNEGVLRPLRIVIPPGLLDPPRSDDPAACPAVVGGNVETSQRIVDVVLGALGVVAASQGTMNNLAFGDERFGYYETVGGGGGAGPEFDGASAVHVHMTNTRLTDPEVLEARYPVRLRRFAIRRGSGGAGRRCGGDGIIREFEFLAPLTLSLLSQRRTRPPFGLRGGQPGLPGAQVLHRADGTTETLPGCVQRSVGPGDVFTLETPGGGGFGATCKSPGRLNATG